MTQRAQGRTGGAMARLPTLGLSGGGHCPPWDTGFEQVYRGKKYLESNSWVDLICRILSNRNLEM